MLSQPGVGGVAPAPEWSMLPQRVKDSVGVALPVAEFRIGQPTQGLVGALVDSDIGAAPWAEVDQAVALAVDDLAIHQVRLCAAVVAVDVSHPLPHASLYRETCSGVSVSMPTCWHS